MPIRLMCAVFVVALGFGLIPGGDAVASEESTGPQLVFGSDRDGNDELYVGGTDGEEPTNVSNHSASDTSPSWSPDGTMIAFVSDRNGNPDVWVMDADGGNAGNVSTSPDHESDPAWSPDGTRIAYSATREILNADGSFETVLEPSIFVFDLRTGDRIRLAVPDLTMPWGGDLADTASDGQPTWSPDGSEVVFVRRYGGATPTAQTTAIFTVAAEGEGTPAFVAPGGWDVAGLDWSSDGEFLIWGQVGVHHTWATLHRLHLPTGESDDLAIPLPFTHNVEPAISSDGMTVAFAAYTLNAESADIYEWRLDRSVTPHRVTSDPAWDTEPDWQSWYPQVGLVDTATGWWTLRQGGTVASFFYGNPGDHPFVGDWNCDGTDTPGLFRRSDGYVYLRNSNTQGNADVRFYFGNPGDIPLAGDFDGDGCDTVSIYRPSEARFYIINQLGGDDAGLGAAEYSFLFGNTGDEPLVGDWDGDGVDEIGLYRDTTGLFYYRKNLTAGVAEGQFYFGDPGDQFIAGDWGGIAGQDTPAVFRPQDTTYYFRNTLTQGNAHAQFTWPGAAPDSIPVAGVFNLD